MLKKIKKITGILLLIAGTIWLGGFLLFMLLIEEIPKKNFLGSAHAIVVLTGGTNRINTGFDLLVDKRAEYLLISGVDKDVSLDDLIKLWGKDPDSLPCCTALGKTAKNTIENAEETKRFIESNDIKSFFLVTSHYHMPRVLIEFQSVIPEGIAVQYAVKPEGYSFKNAKMMYLIFREYNKFLVSFTRNYIIKGS